MQTHRIAIQLSEPVTPSLTHQLRNCAEDFFRALRDVRYAEVENMDSAIDTVWVSVRSKGKLSATLKAVEKCVADSGLWDRREVLTENG